MSDGIGGWLYAIFAVSLGVGAAELLAPLGELRRYVKYVASLVVALSLVAPLSGFLSGLGELTLGLDELALGEYDGGSGDAVAAAGIAAIEDGIADEVEARFGITVGVRAMCTALIRCCSVCRRRRMRLPYATMCATFPAAAGSR